MTLSELKNQIDEMEAIHFLLPNGEKVPSHFHITEVGQVTKVFIDCGGTVRREELVSFQLWHANDFDHRINASTLMKIISIAEDKLALRDGQIEVEYQSDTIGKYGLELQGNTLQLTAKMTDCLAPDKCNIPEPVKEISHPGLAVKNNACAPGSGCC